MAHADMFGICGKMKIQPGRRDEVIDLIREAVSTVGGGSGLIAYNVFVTHEDPDTILETELWTDQAAHDTWISGPARPLAAKIDALLAEPPTAWPGDVLYATGASGAL